MRLKNGIKKVQETIRDLENTSYSILFLERLKIAHHAFSKWRSKKLKKLFCNGGRVGGKNPKNIYTRQKGQQLNNHFIQVMMKNWDSIFGCKLGIAWNSVGNFLINKSGNNNC